MDSKEDIATQIQTEVPMDSKEDIATQIQTEVCNNSREDIATEKIKIALKEENVSGAFTTEIFDLLKYTGEFKLITQVKEKESFKFSTEISCYECGRKCSSKNRSGTKYLCTVCYEKKNFCDGCKCVKKRSHLTNGECKECRKLTDKYSRVCYRCRVGKIGPEEPDEMDMCSTCYIDECTRQCSVCKKKTIHPNAPSFVSVCFNCQNTAPGNKSKFTAKKGGSSKGKDIDPLPECATLGCKILVKESWQKKCTSCYAKSMSGGSYSGTKYSK